MRSFINHAHAIILRMREKARANSARFQCAVERVLALTVSRQPVSVKDAYSYSRSLISCSMLNPEPHIAAIVILIISISTSIFMPYDAADITTRISLISLAMLLGTMLSLFILYLLLPLHLLVDISLWSIAVVHCLVAAGIFSLIEPEVIILFAPYPIPSFLEIFIPFFLLSILVDDFILWNFKGRICARTYRRRHQAGTIETLLPSQKRGEVWLISAADHYVEITTKNGKHMHRMTMKAAVEMAGPTKGQRVHRSHWVAFAAMLSLESVSGRYTLTLRSGAKVPVSPKQAPEIQRFLAQGQKQAAE